MTDSQSRALDLAKGKTPLAKEIERVAQALGDARLAAWAFTQWELRDRARVKFKRASEMLFDREGLEMATHEAVAAWRASLFPEGSRVVDMTVGIGADLIGLASNGSATGFEKDPERAVLARHNLAVHGVEAKVIQGDCLSERLDADFLFADPARRDGTRRTATLEGAVPDPLALAARANEVLGGAIKLSPLTNDADLDRVSPSRLFVSFGRECREALALVGSLSEGRPRAAAVIVETGETVEGGHPPRQTVGQPLGLVHEADPAVIRAGALGRANIPALGDAPGYLTSDSKPEVKWIRSYETLWSGPFKVPKIKAVLDGLGLGLAAVKTRGVRLDPAQVESSLRNGLPRTLVLLVFRSDRSSRAVLAAPL